MFIVVELLANHGVVAAEPGGGGGDRAGALVLGDGGGRGAGAGAASPPPVASTPGNAVLSRAENQPLQFPH